MKRLLGYVLLLAVALGLLAWFFAGDPGYVLVSLHGYTLEMTAAAALCVLIAVWLVLRVLGWVLGGLRRLVGRGERG